MRPGRCITADYQHVMNCRVDILPHIDERCGGKQECEVVVGALEQFSVPCQKDFKSYLEAAYTCVEGRC